MEEPSPTRWRLTVAYRGGGFVGWQVQPGQRTVQGELERALEILLGHPVRIAGSGRTDAGVHALGQTCAFDTPVPRSARSIRDGVNAYLPDDVACVEAVEVPRDFNPRRGARRKLYRYTWLDRPARCPHRATTSWHHRARLDDRAMHQAAQVLVGTHDFQAFRAVGCAAPTSLRTIDAARVVRDGDVVHFEIEGTGFLRHMVRILAGTLTEVGHGQRGIDAIATALAAKRRDAAGRTAPPHGLTLVWVRYGEP